MFLLFAYLIFQLWIVHIDWDKQKVKINKKNKMKEN